MSKIDFSFLTNKIYIAKGKDKEDITNEVVKAIQIMLHNGIEFDYLYSKIDNKTFKLKLEEVEDTANNNKIPKDRQYLFKTNK